MQNLGVVLCIEANLSQENNDALLDNGYTLNKVTFLPIELFHVIENNQSDTNRLSKVESYLNDSKNHLIKLGCDNTTFKIAQGDFKEKLLETYPNSKLIVLGKSGLDNKNNKTESLGSNLEAIIKNGDSPVLIQKGNLPCNENILLAFDGRASIAKVTECPFFLSLAKNANQVHVVSINNNLPLLEEQHEILCTSLIGQGINIKSVFVDKCRMSVAEKLASYQAENQIGLTIIGAFAKKKVRQFFLGSQTSQLLKDINCSIMFYR